MAKFIKKAFLLLSLSVLSFIAKANDGAFYSRGTQLIPIVETDISVQKEVLKIDRVYKDFYNSYYEVSVYYEFFNPNEAKDLLVGFEAASPSEGGWGNFPNHPCIFGFKAIMNGTDLPYEVAHVPYPRDEDGYVNYRIGDYYKNGRFQDLTLKQCQSLVPEDDYYDAIQLFYYVYHFNAHFNKGVNIIEHTYRFEGSSYNVSEYIFDYVLTAANRWANNGIDDFTLIINMGDRESFTVRPTFFKNAGEWTFNGKGKVFMEEVDYYDFSDDREVRPLFHVQEGSIVFHKKNFHPDGELCISKIRCFCKDIDEFKEQYFHLDKELYGCFNTETEEVKRILKNLPFAYRGNVFKTKSLQQFFESTKWYIPNPDYQSTMEGMTNDEKEWIMHWSK